MAFCGKCGTQIPEGSSACPSCGAAVNDTAQNGTQQNNTQNSFNAAVNTFTNTKDSDAPEQPVNPPKTGDTTNLGLWISLMGLSLAGLFISLVVVKKNSYHGKRTK